MEYKICITIYLPILEEKYDVLVPVDRKVHDIIDLMSRALPELTNEYYKENRPNLYNKNTGKMYDLNQTIKETDIRNGTRVIIM